jgi:hypothetical protein
MSHMVFFVFSKKLEKLCVCVVLKLFALVNLPQPKVYEHNEEVYYHLLLQVMSCLVVYGLIPYYFFRWTLRIHHVVYIKTWSYYAY